MGLTIHYSLSAKGDEAQARRIIQALHQTAQLLPFEELGQIVKVSGQQCDFKKRPQNDSLRWLFIQAVGSVEFHPQVRQKETSTWFDVPPSTLIAFETWPGEGCESANFGLCRYPPVIETGYGLLKTGLAGWRWSSFCKTQYASNPNCGGAAHFLKCHLSVIAMLDRAKQLGCLDGVSDEGHFWEKRDLSALLREIGSWNELLAAFGGKLKDFLADNPVVLQSTIAHYPNFEQLEAAGQSRLSPELQQLFALIGRVQVSQQQGSEVSPTQAP